MSASASLALNLVTLNVNNDQVKEKMYGIKITKRKTNGDLLSKKKIYEEYGNVFDTFGSLPGELHLEVDKSIQPVQHVPRKIPVAMKEDIMKKIDKLNEQKIVAKVNEPTDWISSMVVVKKRQSNKLCICIDLHDLNQALQRPCYPQPTIENILPQLSKARVFSVLDAKYGFWQVKLDEETSYLTAFWSHCGRLRWLRMSFGINTTLEEYQRKQTEHVADLPDVAVIADDHLVFGWGSTMEEACKDHDSNLHGLLERTRKIGLWFSSAKM